jgi:integrase/recombinase XerD
VTHHEKVTREEIARRNYTEGTMRAYLRALNDLADYFQQPPEHLTPGQIREYTAHLISERKLSGNTVNQMVGDLRFFYFTVLNKPWRGHEMPYPKKSMHLPVIWSPDEVARLIDAARTRFYRTIIMTLYATGMRRAEVAALKVCDVDSARMVLHVQEGKGRKDRDVVLSPHLLEELRQHYRRLRRNPALWLFPGGTHHTAETPITEKVVWHAWRRAAQRCGVN